MSKTVNRKTREDYKQGTECVWINKIGNRTPGIYLGIKGASGRQAIFIPKESQKPIYIDVTQLSF